MIETKSITTNKDSEHHTVFTTFFSFPGQYNRDRNAECEDVLLFDETQTIKLFGLADGQTGKKYCKEGGQKALRIVFDYIKRNKIHALSEYEHIDEIQFELIKMIRDSISELSTEKNENKSEFSSTLVVFAYDKQTGQYVTVHLGDGGIVGSQVDGDTRFISAPENGLTSYYTWLTTSEDALFHIRIGFGNVNRYRRVLMMTDGVSVICKGKNLFESAKKQIRAYNQIDLLSVIERSCPQDDASCIIIDFINSNHAL